MARHKHHWKLVPPTMGATADPREFGPGVRDCWYSKTKCEGCGKERTQKHIVTSRGGHIVRNVQPEPEPEKVGDYAESIPAS